MGNIELDSLQQMRGSLPCYHDVFFKGRLDKANLFLIFVGKFVYINYCRNVDFGDMIAGDFWERLSYNGQNPE